MSVRKKKVCIDHNIKSIWRPIATNATSSEGLSFSLMYYYHTDFLILPITSLMFMMRALSSILYDNDMTLVLCFAESSIAAATVESGAISNEHLMKLAADENTVSGTSSGQLKGNVENKVLEGDSSLSAEKHSISVQARLYIFTSFFISSLFFTYKFLELLFVQSILNITVALVSVGLLSDGRTPLKLDERTSKNSCMKHYAADCFFVFSFFLILIIDFIVDYLNSSSIFSTIYDGNK